MATRSHPLDQLSATWPVADAPRPPRLWRLLVIGAATGFVVALWALNGGREDPGAPVGARIAAPTPEVRAEGVQPPLTSTSPARDRSNVLPRPPELAEPERPDRFIRFVIQPGDTIYDLSLVYGVEIDQILRFNPNLGDGARVDVGDVVMVPVYDR